MKKIIKEVDEKHGIVQITIADERWYTKQISNLETGLPELLFVPSVTWIAGHYPKGIGFYKWLADKGWDEAQAIKAAAGDKGSKVHEAISAILRGEEVRIDSRFVNPTTEQEEELALEEVEAIKSFVDWRNMAEPISLGWDLTVFSEEFGFAGTIDHIYRFEDEPHIGVIQDFKTSSQVWPEYELQVSAYKRAAFEFPETAELLKKHGITELRLEILQVGYQRNRSGYKMNEVEDKFDLFLAARQIWENESSRQAPKKREYPIVLSPAADKNVASEVVADLMSDTAEANDNAPKAKKKRATKKRA